MMVLTWMGFTLPPECAAYWVGEVGQPPSQDRAKRLANEATQHMAMNLARNLVYYAQLLKKHRSYPRTSRSLTGAPRRVLVSSQAHTEGHTCRT